MESCLLQSQLQQIVVELKIILDVLLLLTLLDLVERRLRNINVASLDQLRHLPIKEGQKQCANVRAVNVRIGHDDDAVIAKLIRIVIIPTNPTPHGRNQRADLIGRDHAIEAGALDIQNLAFQRQDGLRSPIPPLLGGPPC